MKKIIFIICSLFFGMSVAFAQESEDGDDSEKPAKDVAVIGMNEPGDQFIKLGVMPSFPLNFDDALHVGGAGAVGYHRFITSWAAVGVDVNFGYHPTIGSNIFTYIPIFAAATVQPTVQKFEFPLTVEVGVALENYMNKNYFPAFVAKAEAGVYYRATPSWSFGANAAFTYMPQWYKDSEYNDYGLFLGAEVSARYHF